MHFLTRVLDSPKYGFVKEGRFYRPTRREILTEFFGRLNIAKSAKNWLPFFGWTASLSLGIPLAFFLLHHFSWPLFAVGFVYSMVLMGSHGTFWLHRHSTHRAFKFKNPIVREICRNLVIKIVPEEIYVVSHHVHHRFSERPGDPYNVHGGWLYCFLADVNHQTLAKDLTEKEYLQACQLLKHTGMRLNSYAQYQKWGSLCHPAWTMVHYALNWGFWFLVFYGLGGMALATAIFGSAAVWAIGVRTFNFEGHGRGKLRQREGVDFFHDDLSVNQAWPGWVAGEWHNNHHLFPRSARSGFFWHQPDLPWYLIRVLAKLGQVDTVLDNREEFLAKYYLPWKSRHLLASGTVR